MVEPEKAERKAFLVDSVHARIGHEAAYGALVRVAPESREGWLHALTCPRCRERARGVLAAALESLEEVSQEAAPGGEEAAAGAEDQADDRGVLEEAVAAKRLAERLLELRPAERRTVIETDSRFADAVVGTWATYAEALALVRGESATDLRSAGLLAALAQLRRAQGRLGEAVRLFVQAAEGYALATLPEGDAACRIQAGWVLVEQGSFAQARLQLKVARALLDVQETPALAARTTLLLAYSCCALGRRAEAKGWLSEAERVSEQVREKGEQEFRSWWTGRLAAREGRRHDAGHLFEEVRRRLLASGSLAEVARYSLEILAFRVESGRLDSLARLEREISTAFGATPAAVRCARVLKGLRDLAVSGSSDFAAALDAARDELSRVGIDEERPHRIADLQELTDKLVREVSNPRFGTDVCECVALDRAAGGEEQPVGGEGT